MDRSEGPLSVGDGSFEVNVEIEGRVCVVCGGTFWEVVSHGRRLVASMLSSIDLSPVSMCCKPKL